MNEELNKIIDESDSILGEVMRGARKATRGRPLVNKKTTGRRESTSDKYLRLCDECNFVWEREFNTWRAKPRNSHTTKYICKYEEIPRYKKPVETCPICLGEPHVEERKIY
tara:strand:+ start:119 stop:451 length:333 start_codon:yes stop_codon:yes gene_type:complete